MGWDLELSAHLGRDEDLGRDEEAGFAYVIGLVSVGSLAGSRHFWKKVGDLSPGLKACFKKNGQYHISVGVLGRRNAHRGKNKTIFRTGYIRIRTY
jgi:hypothetical protein